MAMLKGFVQVVLAISAALAVPNAAAQAYPSKVVRVVVPYPPGGSLDVLVRVFTDKLTTRFGQSFIVENRAGANGNIGAEAVARSSPDGYTLLWTIDATVTINPVLYTKLGYDPARDLVPITMTGSVPSVLVLHPSVPVTSVSELIVLAKKQPLNASSGGNGSPGHLALELFNRVAGINIMHVPYKGNAPAVASVVSGETQLLISGITAVIPHVRASRLRGLAVTGTARAESLPELSTFTELGYPDVRGGSWMGVFAPAGTPRPLIERLHAEINAASALADVQERMRKLGVTPQGSTPVELAERIRGDTQAWAKVVREAGIRPD